MRWWVHWGMQYLLARTPGGELIHRVLQEQVGQLRNIENANQFENSLKIVGLASSHGGPLPGLRVVEIGTGWVPALPVALALAGCEVHTFDVAQLTKPEYLQRTLTGWKSRLPELARSAKQPLDEISQRWDRLSKASNLADLCQETGGKALAPCDTTELPDESGTYDLAVSNLVMQCVPDSLITPVIRETVRLLKPSGWAIHRMHLTDEYAFKDTQRHDLDFLKHPREVWDRWFNHTLKVQNRWRAPQFLAVFRESGLTPIEVIQRCRQSDIDYVRQLQVAPEFQEQSELDLASVALTVVLQKPPVSPTARPIYRLLPLPDEGGLALDDPWRLKFENH